MLAVPDGYLPLRIDKLLGRSPRGAGDGGLLTHALTWQDTPRSDMKRFALLRVVFAVAERFPQEARARNTPHKVFVRCRALQQTLATTGTVLVELHVGSQCRAYLGFWSSCSAL